MLKEASYKASVRPWKEKTFMALLATGRTCEQKS